MNTTPAYRKAILPILVLGLASFITYIMIANKPVVAKKEGEELVRHVKVIEYKPQSIDFPVSSQGVVLPLTRIRYLSEVSGRVVEVADSWQDGGYFRQGEVMLRIEDHVYQGQFAKAQAQLAQAELALTQEKALSYVAEKNWQAGKSTDDNPAGKSLALREPQLASAQAQLLSAKADLVSATLMLDKTKIRAPFDGIINNKVVDIGQVLAAGQQLADFYGIAKAEVRVPLTQIQQAYLALPPLATRANIPVDIIYRKAENDVHIAGTLTRTSGVLDESTRVLHGIIEVNDPYNLHSKAKDVLPIGAFVEVKINSQVQENIIKLPKRLLRPGNRLWVVDPESKLRLRDVRILPSQDEWVYIQSGLEVSDKIITSSIVDAYPGNPVEFELNDNAEY